VQEVAAPSLAHTGDVRHLIGDTGGEQDPSGRQRLAAGEPHGEPGLDGVDMVAEQLDAVAGHLRSPCGQEIGRGHPVAR